jgi:sporulation protein YlmC with PRC-barrel domain
MEMDEHNNTALRLEELSTSDFEVADHQPDITGWELVDSSGLELGEIEDLIFDREAKKVRYLVVSLELDELDSPRLVLVPIGIVSLDEDNEEVLLPQGVVTGLLTLPVYRSGTVISPAEELAVRYAFMGREGLMLEVSDVYESHPEDFYSHAHFDDTQFIKKTKDI